MGIYGKLLLPPALDSPCSPKFLILLLEFVIDHLKDVGYGIPGCHFGQFCFFIIHSVLLILGSFTHLSDETLDPCILLTLDIRSDDQIEILLFFGTSGLVDAFIVVL